MLNASQLPKNDKQIPSLKIKLKLQKHMLVTKIYAGLKLTVENELQLPKTNDSLAQLPKIK